MNGGTERDDGLSVSTVRTTLKSILFRSRRETIIDECRRCGTTVESIHATCPACGGEDIAEYRIN